MRRSESNHPGNQCCLGLLLWILMFGGWGVQVKSDCPFQEALRGRWLRASDGKFITFTATSSNAMSGHQLQQGPLTVTSFDCSASSGTNVILGVPDMLDHPFKGSTSVYFCWKLVPITITSFLLYELTPIDTDDSSVFTNQRIFSKFMDPSAPAVSEVCSLGSSQQLPVMLYKMIDSETEINLSSLPVAAQTCPPEVQTVYSYIKEGSGTNCAASDSSLGFCDDRKTATINYTTCAQPKIFYSQDGLLTCVGSFTSNNDLYFFLINNDATVNDASTFRLLCTKYRRTGSTEQMWVYPETCDSSTNQQLTLARKESCAPADEDPSDSELDIVPIVVGVVVSVVVVAVIIVGAILIYKLVYLKKKRAITPLDTKKAANGNAKYESDGAKQSKDDSEDSSKPNQESDNSKPNQDSDNSKPNQESDNSKPNQDTDNSKPNQDTDKSKPSKNAATPRAELPPLDSPMVKITAPLRA